jgi:hypothetical protein
MEFETGPHSSAALMQARPRGARLHDYWQQASKRGVPRCLFTGTIITVKNFSPPTLAGALPPEFIYGACPSSIFLWLYLSSLPACVSVGSPALYCIVFTAVLLTCVCVN